MADYCVRCGQPLTEGASGVSRSRHRGQFAAAPAQRLLAPRLISTLFPQLPSDDMRAFGIALAGGVAVVMGLALAELFAVALIAAALLVPVVTVIYLYDVDVYEDEPIRVLALTVAWGAVAGGAIAVLSQALEPADSQFVTESAASSIPIRGLVIPLVALALSAAGPLVLLPYRRFNDVLDGATFGAASGVTLAAAQVIVQAWPSLGRGLDPVGDVLPWLLRLLTISVALPVLAAAAVGSAVGAFWLRYRAPVRDRHALGALGNPPLALLAAAALFVAAALAQILVPLGALLALLVALDAGGLLWLRRVIHVGLLEEASEIEIGPPIRCANCGGHTHAHTFCERCGISLRALPKGPGARSAPAPAPREAQS